MAWTRLYNFSIRWRHFRCSVSNEHIKLLWNNNSFWQDLVDLPFSGNNWGVLCKLCILNLSWSSYFYIRGQSYLLSSNSGSLNKYNLHYIFPWKWIRFCTQSSNSFRNNVINELQWLYVGTTLFLSSFYHRSVYRRNNCNGLRYSFV